MEQEEIDYYDNLKKHITDNIPIDLCWLKEKEHENSYNNFIVEEMEKYHSYEDFIKINT